jgi:CubicO group peptidase (beta-lactamase class C family)
MDETQTVQLNMTRRSLLRAIAGAAVVGAAALPIPEWSGWAVGAPAQGARKVTDGVLQAFDADVRSAMETFSMVGAGVALFEGNDIVYNRGFGTRDVLSNAPVTPRTRFRIASNTKSMTSLLLARYVDDGLLRWDTRAAELWPEFRAPTEHLTSTLRIADLLGMGSGVAESATIEFFVFAGEFAALDLLRSIAYLPVIAPPNTTYYYNNTLVAAAPFLGMIARGTAVGSLEEAYAAELQRVIFEPVGMADAAVASDPRPLGPDFATGYTKNLFADVSRMPFISIDGFGPAGAGLASTTDMARYLITQMHRGVTPDGRRIVSAANVARTHQPGIAVPPDALNALPAVLLRDTASTHYCLGWFDQTFRDGRHLLWHAGGIDGFASLMGFFPGDQLGFVFLTNLDPVSGSNFNFSIQGSLLSLLFGLNSYVPELLTSIVPQVAERKAELAARTRPVDPTAVAPYLGLYSQGFRLRLNPPNDLRLEHDIRSFPVLALVDGGYVVADGPGVVAEKTVTLATGADGLRTLTIKGFEPVRWLTGD